MNVLAILIRYDQHNRSDPSYVDAHILEINENTIVTTDLINQNGLRRASMKPNNKAGSRLPGKR